MTKVLIVDDDDEWGRLAKRRLEGAGLQVCVHRGALGALNAICDGLYDLVLLDVKMPGLSGDRIAHTLYHVRGLPRLKLVFCSAIDAGELRKLSEQLKVDGYFSKSAGYDELLRLVERLTGNCAPESPRRPAASRGGHGTEAQCPVCQVASASREKERAIATILLAEDHEMSRDMLGRRLERRKFAILFAKDGTQAVAMAKAASPDLILMDINLPVMNGLEATRKLKATPETRSIPVIALTAHSALYDRDQCLKAGADDWEGKPVDFAVLLAKIDTLLSTRHTTAT